MITLYGIKNCSSMKKAFDWCAEQGVEYTFHDYKKAGAPAEQLKAWCQVAGWQAVINKRGTTWRKLSAAQQVINSEQDAIALMLANPSLIKRPVVETGKQLLIGFEPQLFAQHVK